MFKNEVLSTFYQKKTYFLNKQIKQIRMSINSLKIVKAVRKLYGLVIIISYISRYLVKIPNPHDFSSLNYIKKTKSIYIYIYL